MTLRSEPSISDEVGATCRFNSTQAYLVFGRPSYHWTDHGGPYGETAGLALSAFRYRIAMRVDSGAASDDARGSHSCQNVPQIAHSRRIAQICSRCLLQASKQGVLNCLRGSQLSVRVTDYIIANHISGVINSPTSNLKRLRFHHARDNRYNYCPNWSRL